MLCFMLACSAPSAFVYQRSGKVVCQKYEQDVIHLRAEASAETTAKAISFAERNAIENLLFKGIPASNQEKPLVANETEAMRQNPEYFNNLINKEDYQRFVMKSEIIENVAEQKAHFVKQLISIDLNAFRTDLEQNKIVRKFGL